MSYNTNIPQAASKRVISQRQIQANFTEIFNAFAENHSALGNADLQGKHNMLVLRPQVPDPATTATQNAIYNKKVATIPNLFFRPNNSQTPIQMTYPSLVVGIQTPPSTYFAQQYSFVAGPFVFYAGIILNPTNGQTVTLLPATTLRYVGVCVKDFVGTVVSSVAATSIVANSFNINFQAQIGSTRDVYYIAIGN